MLPEGYPDGVEPILVLEDLRWSVVDKASRVKILHLLDEYKTRRLTLDEARWIREIARRNIKRIREMRKSQDAVRMTDFRRRTGEKRFRELRASAERETRLRLLKKLSAFQQEVDSADKSASDFGI